MPRVESHSAPQIHSSSQGPDTWDPGQNNDINRINESYFVKCFSCADLKKNTCEHCVCAAWMPASANASCLRQGLVVYSSSSSCGLREATSPTPGQQLPLCGVFTHNSLVFPGCFFPPVYSSLVGKNITQGDLIKYDPFRSVFVFNVVLMTPLGDF